MKTTMYGVMKDGVFLSFTYDDWFSCPNPGCLTVSHYTADITANQVNGEVVTFTVTLDK
jgi:hypothetical protein